MVVIILWYLSQLPRSFIQPYCPYCRQMHNIMGPVWDEIRFACWLCVYYWCWGVGDAMVLLNGGMLLVVVGGMKLSCKCRVGFWGAGGTIRSTKEPKRKRGMDLGWIRDGSSKSLVGHDGNITQW